MSVALLIKCRWSDAGGHGLMTGRCPCVAHRVNHPLRPLSLLGALPGTPGRIDPTRRKVLPVHSQPVSIHFCPPRLVLRIHGCGWLGLLRHNLLPERER
jgi:hypothetical protein